MLMSPAFVSRCITAWTHVILDEVHDREEDLDFVSLLVKKFVNTNSRGVKVVLMSATLDVDKLTRFVRSLIDLHLPRLFIRSPALNLPRWTVLWEALVLVR